MQYDDPEKVLHAYYSEHLATIEAQFHAHHVLPEVFEYIPDTHRAHVEVPARHAAREPSEINGMQSVLRICRTLAEAGLFGFNLLTLKPANRSHI